VGRCVLLKKEESTVCVLPSLILFAFLESIQVTNDLSRCVNTAHILREEKQSRKDPLIFLLLRVVNKRTLRCVRTSHCIITAY